MSDRKTVVFGPSVWTLISWCKSKGLNSKEFLWANERNTLRIKNYDLLVLYYIGPSAQLTIFHRLKAYGKAHDPDMKVTFIR